MGNQIQDGNFSKMLDASFAGGVRDSNSTSGGSLCVFGSNAFVTAVSRIIAESLDAGLRVDGLPGLQFGKCVLETLSSLSAKTWASQTRECQSVLIHLLTIVYLRAFDHVPPNIP